MQYRNMPQEGAINRIMNSLKQAGSLKYLPGHLNEKNI